MAGTPWSTADEGTLSGGLLANDFGAVVVSWKSAPWASAFVQWDFGPYGSGPSPEDPEYPPSTTTRQALG
jgi:hypothetical protein